MGLDLSSSAVGIVLGFGLKFGADWWTVSRQDKRQDLVWRREHLTDSAAVLLTACVDATKANGWVVRCVEELGNAEGASSPQVMPFKQRLNEAYDMARMAAEEVDRAIQRVILYSHDETREAALELVRVTKEHPSMKTVISGPFHNQSAADAFRDLVTTGLETESR